MLLRRHREEQENKKVEEVKKAVKAEHKKKSDK